MMRKTLEQQLGDHPFFVNVRGRGLRFSLEYNCHNKNEFGSSLTNNMLIKHKIFISAKWHRINFTPALIIAKQEAEKVLEKLILEFKQISESHQRYEKQKIF